MVWLWKVPSSVRGQVTGLPIVDANVRSVAPAIVLSQASLKLDALNESLLAEAKLTAAPKNRATARQHSISLLREYMCVKPFVRSRQSERLQSLCDCDGWGQCLRGAER